MALASTSGTVVDGIVQHMERYLGEIQRGWSTYENGLVAPFQVVEFGEVPREIGWTVLATLGLNQYPTRSAKSGKAVRQELVLILPAASAPGPFPSVLQQIGTQVVHSGQAVLRGEFLELDQPCPFVPDSQLSAFFATLPSYLPDAFNTYHGPEFDVIFPWLIPITPSELAFVKNEGWSKFEDLLVEQDPNLLDLRRAPLLLY
ncbi:hypothetical protein EX895_001545 [Sporisorium graminicola]|uniref:Suppressor of fused-like domain-containing protein n=1 Tax=Sporisorium graminicola TaxID=280036 RepID=A0A4U7KYW7_9BASI|nr:hypothetical protein EX895_001545 [Sporisorium graminicola]TKY89760.1 hypothetical protein EX895_001545 [Sporisorium graminicola]